MKVIFSLGFSDITETQKGIKSILKALGIYDGIKAISFATGKHFASIIKGEANRYPEKGKKRIWFKLNYLKYIYDYLNNKDAKTAGQKIESIIQAPALDFIGQMIPESSLFTKDFMLNNVWQHLVANDYNIEGKAMPPEGNSISLNVKRCFYDEVSRDVGLMPVAHLMCQSDYIFWEHYHPNVKFSRTKTLIAGDDHCNHTLTWIE